MNVCRFLSFAAALAIAAVAASGAYAAASRQLTIADIVAAHPVSGSPPFAFTWAPDGSRYVYSVRGTTENSPPEMRMHDVRTGSDRPLFAARSQARGSRSRPIAQIVWSDDSSRIAFLNDGNLEVAPAAGGSETVLASDADDPQWSPNGSALAYVHANDLYVVDVATHQTRRMTHGGSATRIDGDPDWLYSEEMGVQHGYAWSPDGRTLAYLSFDESPVTAFPIQNFVPTINTVEWQRYPLAGGKNPRVSLHAVDVRTGTSRLLYDGAPRDEYVLSFTWLPDSSGLLDEIVDRAQQHLRLQYFARTGASSHVVLSESDPHFVDVQDAPVFLHDGSAFLWLSERDGVQALYRVATATGAATRLSGAEPIAQVLRVDEAKGVVYVAAFAPSRRDRALLRIPLNGGAATNVTPEIGSHAISMARNGGDAFLDTYSSFGSPPSITLRSLSGTGAAEIFRTPSLSAFELGTTKALEVPSQWGPLDAQITLPADFDAARKYPVIVQAYGGPLPVSWGVPTDDSWQGLFPFLLAQHGFLVFSIDGPASNNDRAPNARLFSESMGEIAMAGQLAGVAWLKTQPYVDASRLGLFGWSYGGYLTAFTLTHAPGVFRTGIAGAPPADWRYYDSAYTERYMGMPQRQKAAYERTSVLPAAGALQSQLLLIQGSSDDNVHLMNSIAILRAMIAAGKQVDYFVYPGARHGVAGIAAQRHLDQKMLDWWERTLK